jgi:putative hydrolase of the HAD superfamily
MSIRVPREFGHVETWVFDLDNTLYPPALDLWEQIDTRMRDFISRFLSIPKDEAFKIQKHYYKTYGTSLKGLMIEHNLEPEEFLEYVHNIDRSSLVANPDLRDGIERLQGRKLILTNGTRAHAHAVLDQIGLGDLFDDVHDIISANYTPKPHLAVYDGFLEAHGVHAERAAMFEDLARNLEAPHRLGMTTVLVVPKTTETVIREQWEHEGRDEPYVDHVTDDLADFLRRITNKLV